jgi:phenylalanyl-tRNA synthetase alpha chain
LIAKERRRIEDIFHSMWFDIEYWHDVVSKYENFYAVNIPPTHPATEMHDTFYLDQTTYYNWSKENLVLRTHTSAMQNALIKKYWIPLKVVVPWKVYRFENTDASHDTVFWQIEWMVIDRWINLTHFKYLITEILSAIFETKVNFRMRPAFFPFVEPWFEIDASCPICKWKGCWLCKRTWWIEILGAGMIHPNVIKQALWQIPEGVRWFAFGMGLTRLVAIKYGIKDIRLLTSGDLRFVKSF